MPPQQPMGGPGNGNKVPLFVALGVVVLVVLGVGGYLLFGKSNNSGGTSAAPAAHTSSESVPAAPSSAASAATSVSSQAAPTATALTGVWNGTYTCGQGATALTLTIAPAPGGGSGLHAIFAFASTPTNPVPPGSFTLSGTLTGSDLLFVPSHWIHQPAGYTMVGLEATVTGANPTSISGTVQSSGCSSFTVTRQ